MNDYIKSIPKKPCKGFQTAFRAFVRNLSNEPKIVDYRANEETSNRLLKNVMDQRMVKKL